MDTDANHGGKDKERIMYFPVNHHAVQPVIIEYPVIDPFGCCALVKRSRSGTSVWSERLWQDNWKSVKP